MDHLGEGERVTIIAKKILNRKEKNKLLNGKQKCSEKKGKRKEGKKKKEKARLDN